MNTNNPKPTIPVQFEYISLAEAISKLQAYMKSRNYSLDKYELTSIGHGCCTRETSPSLWYYSFCLRERGNPIHEININIPCYVSDKDVSYEELSREYPIFGDYSY